MVNRRPTPEELEEPISAEPLTFEQIVESLVAPASTEPDEPESDA